MSVESMKLAKKLAAQNKLTRAYQYDLFYREFDNMVELVGLIDDPTQSMNDFQGREMLFPKKWVTLQVIDSKYEVPNVRS